jgi:hypothetical protein
MSLNVPLGVRLFRMSTNIDTHITKWVQDFTFRHTVPGGCASCTIKLRNPSGVNPLDPEKWGSLYSRVQIYDTRSAEVLWEGRVEDPAKQTEDGGWELGVLGSSVAATDVSLPMIYIDNTLENWVPFEADAFQHEKDDATQTLVTRMVEGFVYEVGQEYYVWTYVGGNASGFIIGRVGTTYDGSGPNPAADDLFDMLLDYSAVNVDITAFNLAPVYKANQLPTDFSTADLANQVYYKIRRRTSNYTITSGDVAVARFIRPVVQAMRIDRNRENYVLAADYNHGDFIYPWHVIEDTVGRFLNGGWDQGTSLSLSFQENVPESGLVSGFDSFINKDSLRRIVNLQWPDGVDAKSILDTMMTVQPEAYWAIWTSRHLNKNVVYVAADEYDFDHKFRFEWATWPESWNYFVSTKDGMQSQKDGESLYNMVTMKVTYQGSITPGLSRTHTNMTYGDRSWGVPELEHEFTRSNVIKRESEVGEFDDAVDIAMDEAENTRYVKDTGTITIRRPVYYFDSGKSSGWGFSGMVDPWEIRPGKLMRIQDIHPEADAGNMSMDMNARTLLNFNPDFETGPATPGWYGNNGAVTRVSDFKVSGGFAGKLTPTGAAGDSFIYTDWQTMLPEEQYAAGGWIRCAVARTVYVMIHFYTAADVFISAASKAVAVAANTWTRVDLRAVSPFQTAKGPMLVTMLSAPPASNVLWIDDMRFEAINRLPDAHRNCVFRMAATTYSTSDNTCTVELDQLPKWSLPTQIANPSSTGKIIAL